MPRFDGTGPRGAGPMTGRGEGHCVLEFSEPGRLARGYAGLQGMPIGPEVEAGMGPMIGALRGCCRPFWLRTAGSGPSRLPDAVRAGFAYAHGPGRRCWGLGVGCLGRRWGRGRGW